MIFPSKKDWWLVLILVAAILVEAIVGVVVLLNGNAPWAGSALVAAAVFIGWLLQSTYYIVGETDLVARSGPFWWTVPLDGIDEITPSHNPLSSPALSLDRFWISYRRGGKKRAIMISPEDKEGFLQAVAARVPALEIEGEGRSASIIRRES